MPIIDLQMRQRELGRIRMGRKSGGTTGHPQKLDKFRFTSASKDLIDAVSALYGGTPAPWANDGAAQFEVYTQANRVPILLPPQPISQWYEMWSGGGCQRRCDGKTNILKDEPCLCPSDPLDRAELASKGQACKPTTRLNVMLRDVPGIGVWRLESHGFHSAVELPMVAEFLAQATEAGTYLPAELALQPRSSKRPGEGTKQWMVPVIEVGATLRQIMSGEVEGLGAGHKAALGGSRRAIEAGKPTEEHFRALAERAETLEELTAAFGQAQKAGFARRGDGLYRFFAQRGEEIKDAGAGAGARGPQSCACGGTVGEDDHETGCPNTSSEDTGIVDAEIVADANELDELWALITENADGWGWDSRQLEREFTAHAGVTPAQADAGQMRAFLAHLRAGSAVAA